jgi:hypothetical protein
MERGVGDTLQTQVYAALRQKRPLADHADERQSQAYLRARGRNV